MIELKRKMWAAMEWEEQIRLFSMRGIVDKVDMFLYLCGLKLVRGGTIPPYPSMGEMQEQGEYWEMMERWMRGEVCFLVALEDSLKNERERGGEGGSEARSCMSEDGTRENGRWGEVMWIGTEELMAVAVERMKWMETDHSLLVLKRKQMEIGGKMFRLPDVMMGNLCFEQWLHAHSWFRMYVRGAKKYREVMGVIEDWGVVEDSFMYERERNEDEGQGTREGKQGRSLGEREYSLKIEQALGVAEELKRAQCGFLACLLKPYGWRWHAGYPWLRKEDAWDGKDEEKWQEWMMRYAPDWLFGMVHKWWEDTIERFRGRKMFPEIFSDEKSSDTGEKEKEDEIVHWVSEMGTINLVREKGNYTSTDDVMREPVPVVLKLMNDVVKENREMKKEMDKAKRR